MFWKKGGKEDLELSLEVTERNSFRVAPEPDEPLVLMIEGQPCRVYDISAGGALFQAPQGIVAGDLRDFKFKLPYPPKVVQGRIKILAADRDRARGNFVEMEDEDRDQVHLYVLETQKRQLKRASLKDRPKDRP